MHMPLQKYLVRLQFHFARQVRRGTAKDAWTKGTEWPRQRTGRSSDQSYLDLRAASNGDSSRNSLHLVM